MSKYYVLEASKNVSDFISVKEGVSTFSKACQMSEFQLIDSVPVIIEVDPDSGKIFQDFIYDKGVPLISDKMKDCFDDCNVDYLFYKKVILTKKQLGIEEIYWLALPPRINCLNRDESDIDDFLNVAEKIVINDDKVGRYDIFKLAGVGNLEIIATEALTSRLKIKKFIGVHINNLD